jgi:putative transcriptional regulator
MVRNRLLQIRLSLGYKFQKDFAEYLDIPQYQYNRYENNENQPSLETALKISIRLNMDLREILYLEN